MTDIIYLGAGSGNGNGGGNGGNYGNCNGGNFRGNFNYNSKYNPSQDSAGAGVEPQSFDEFVGQEKAISQIMLALEASEKKESPFPHTLFTGPSGLGKTTLAKLIGKEKNANVIEMEGPRLNQTDKIEKILTDIKYGDILFIDEIHRTDRAVQEMLYGPMQDRKLGGNSIEAFTLIGATTMEGRLENPFLNRFGLTIKLKLYNFEDIEEILRRNSIKENVEINKLSLSMIARVSRKTPRIGNRIFKRIMEYSLCQNKENLELAKDNIDKMDIKEIYHRLIFYYHPDRNDNPEALKKTVEINSFYEDNDIDSLKKEILKLPLQISPEDVENTLEVHGIDENGLDDRDREYLFEALAKTYPDPIGLKAISRIINEDMSTIENAIEPWLIHLGFIKHTKGGRILRQRAIDWKRYGIADIIKENNDGVIPRPRDGSKYRGGSPNRSRNDELLRDMGVINDKRRF